MHQEGEPFPLDGRHPPCALAIAAGDKSNLPLVFAPYRCVPASVWENEEHGVERLLVFHLASLHLALFQIGTLDVRDHRRMLVGVPRIAPLALALVSSLSLAACGDGDGDGDGDAQVTELRDEIETARTTGVCGGVDQEWVFSGIQSDPSVQATFDQNVERWWANSLTNSSIEDELDGVTVFTVTGQVGDADEHWTGSALGCAEIMRADLHVVALARHDDLWVLGMAADPGFADFDHCGYIDAIWTDEQRAWDEEFLDSHFSASTAYPGNNPPCSADNLPDGQMGYPAPEPSAEATCYARSLTQHVPSWVEPPDWAHEFALDIDSSQTPLSQYEKVFFDENLCAALYDNQATATVGVAADIGQGSFFLVQPGE